MRRIVLLIAALVSTVLVVAQSPEAIRESLRQNPHFAIPVYVAYPPLPIGDIAAAPEGFEPFYFSLAGRHGSRYDVSTSRFTDIIDILKRGAECSILTDTGKRLLARLEAILAAQGERKGELADLGYRQWISIANRAYDNFAPVFQQGSVDAMSSPTLRCVFSMIAFNQGLKERNPRLVVNQDAQERDLPIVRPVNDNPLMTESDRQLLRDTSKKGAWIETRTAWDDSRDVSSFLSKITTDADRLVKECGGKTPFRIARYAYAALVVAENFEAGDRALVTELFTTDEIYGFYVHHTASWINCRIGVGNDFAEMMNSFAGSMIDDIVRKANAAIKGENPNCADLRFTHDTHMAPLMSAIGYVGCQPTYSADLEKATTSFNHAVMTPMAANLQLVLYRNKAGKIYVRSLVNERDAYLPIKCKSAPFYPWSDFCKHVEKSMKVLDAARERVLKQQK